MGSLRRRSQAIPFALVGVLVLGVLAPFASGPADATSAPYASGSGVSAVVDWNGMNVSGAHSLSSALPVTFAPPITLSFHWASNAPSGGGTPAPVVMGSARLTILYFGLPLLTPTVIQENAAPAISGELDLNWSPQGLQFLISGAYEATASMMDKNGTTVFSENFFIDAAAPYVIGAALPALFLILAVLEALSIARSGRHQPLPPPKGSTPTGSAPPTPSASSTPTPANTGPSEPNPPNPGSGGVP